MSQETIDRLRAGLEAFNRTGEIGSEFLDSNVEMQQAASIIDTAGVFHGREGLSEALGELREAFEDLSFEAEEISETPKGEIVAFIRVRGRGMGSGIEMNNAIAWVVSLRDDKITGSWSTRSAPKPSKPLGCRSRAPTRFLTAPRGSLFH